MHVLIKCTFLSFQGEHMSPPQWIMHAYYERFLYEIILHIYAYTCLHLPFYIVKSENNYLQLMYPVVQTEYK